MEESAFMEPASGVGIAPSTHKSEKRILPGIDRIRSAGTKSLTEPGLVQENRSDPDTPNDNIV